MIIALLVAIILLLLFRQFIVNLIWSMLLLGLFVGGLVLLVTFPIQTILISFVVIVFISAGM